MKLISLLTGPVLAMTLTAAHAGDFHNDQMAQLQASMNRANTTVQNSQQQLMANPEIQQQYYQYRQSGGQNSFEQFVYFLGQTPQGQRERINRTNRTINGVWEAQRGYNDAVTANGVSRSKSATERGNVIGNNATYQNSSTGSSHVLPYTWQPNTVNQHNGQHYWVDHAGNYFHIDPNNSGWMAPIYPTYGR